MDTMRLTWHVLRSAEPGGSGQPRNRIREALAGRGIEIGSERHLPDAESNPRGSRRTRNRIQEALEDGVAVAT